MTAKPRVLPGRYSRKPCAHCGSEFLPASWNTKYCKQCRASGKGGLRSTFRSVARIASTCAGCGIEYVTRHTEQRYCGRACAFQSLRDRAEPARRLRQAARAAVKREAKVYKRWARRAKRLATPKPVWTRTCRECCSEFLSRYRRGVFCSRECARKDGKRTERKRRKARLRDVRVESVNPTLVFERDRWLCQLCGCKTLKRARGTCNPRAPELDHIVPLSKGGAHSYKNTQCACRGCNHSKSDAMLGQLRMFGGVATGRPPPPPPRV